MQSAAISSFTPESDEREEFNEIARNDLSLFTQKVFTTVSPGDTYLHNWHIDCICEHLQACSWHNDKPPEINRLIVNVPPRYLKSICASVAWPAWQMGRDPSTRYVAGSYSRTLAFKHSVDTRLIVTTDWYQEMFPGVHLSGDQNAKEKWETTARGHRMATSVGSPPIGEGGDCLVVDDPHNPQTALSDLERKTALDWFDQGFYTRLNDKRNGVIVIIMQRLHDEDLTGHLLSKHSDFVHLKLPATEEKEKLITFGDFQIKRERGEPLHPEREDREILAVNKRILGSYGYAGQYQQNPTPIDGGIVKIGWFKRYRVRPRPEDVRRIIQSWDTAATEKEINDPSVCIEVWETFDGRFLITDVFRDWLQYPDLKRAVINMAQRDSLSPDAVLIENKSTGQALIPDVKQERHPRTNQALGIPVLSIDPEKDKITRMMAASPMLEAGYFELPHQAPWLHEFETEIKSFPLTTYKDQVDSLSQLVLYVKPSRPEFNVSSSGRRTFAEGTQTTSRGFGTITSPRDDGGFI